MTNIACSIVSLVVLACTFFSQVDAHGYVTTPRSRQWVAAEDGVWSGGAPTLPAKENCPSCANTKNADGYCGIVDNRDYDNPLDQSGNPMIPHAQSVYTEGQIIDMEFVFTANHNGHHVTYACPDFDNPTKECFEKYPLEFIEDISMEAYGTDANAPKDPNYPERGYVNPGASHTKMRFKLPEGLTGDMVLLQWHWVTGNSCRSAGYDEYPYPAGWAPANMGPCPDRDNLSPIGVGQPEQFWNCMEVKIVADGEPTGPPPPSPTPPSPTPPSPTPPSPATPSPTPPPPTGNGCCSQNYKTCDATWCGDTEAKCLTCGSAGDKTWLPNGPVDNCIARFGDCTNNMDGCCGPAACIGNQWYRQCLPDPNAPPPSPPTPPPSPAPTTPAPITPAPTPPSPTSASPTYAPVTSAPVVPGSNALFSTSNTRSSYEALKELDLLTNIIQSNPPIYALVAEGGAAGNGNVVSEGQGYGVMIAGITLAAMDTSDPNRQDTMNRFYGFFNGWKRMCEISTPKAFCQSQKFCGGGTTACLPGWKHDKDLTEVTGTGAAPDGDEDAIAGMIMAVQAVENDAQKPSWYDEVRVWADASSTAFLFYNTKSSKTGNEHRIVKLGSCWGGWETEGNNPSYHSPGSYRLMKNYQKDFPDADRDYMMPNFQDGITTETRWNKVIETSYDFLEEAQCDDMGLVPNWAMVTENSSGDINLYPGSFSGSGTPQYEFGAEASRTMWRVLFDVALYPNAAFQNAESFLRPLHSRLDQGFTGNNWMDNTLMPCAGVHNVFPNWRFNAFIYSPVYSTLVLTAGGVDTTTQQNMVDAAGSIVNNIPNGLSYYSRCWSIIGILTLNGDVARAAVNTGISGPTPSRAPTVQPTKSPTVTSTSSPTPSPTPSPTTGDDTSPTSSPTKVHACKPWCETSPTPWETKCTWFGCKLCDECTSSTDSPTSSPVASIPSSSPSASPTNSSTDAPTPSPTTAPPTDGSGNNDDDEISELISLLNILIDLINQLLSLFSGNNGSRYIRGFGK